MVLQGPRMPQVLERLVQLLAAPVREGCAPRRGTDTHTQTWREGRGLVREWRVEMVLRRATSRPRWCKLRKRNLLSSCSRDRYVF